ncbi:RNA polymerase sigma factor [Streptomyces sp. NPDC088719]|uniref:RNA polymerase sigma factor n=1 Tax=Streptomyces sp. NPDC088719 TaxID=3365872 RepID=UPI003829ACBF
MTRAGTASRPDAGVTCGGPAGSRAWSRAGPTDGNREDCADQRSGLVVGHRHQRAPELGEGVPGGTAGPWPGCAAGDAQDFADEVVGQLADAQRLAAAAKALNRLKRGEREVFTLVVWSGLSYTAAAEALGLPIGTVRSRLSRARTKLRRLVEAELRTDITVSRAAEPDSRRRTGAPAPEVADAYRRKA